MSSPARPTGSKSLPHAGAPLCAAFVREAAAAYAERGLLGADDRAAV